MSVNNIFESEEFLNAPKEEKKEIAKSEFLKCQKDFEYFLDTYAKVRHANAGIIKMKAFDFQKDLIIPISYALLHGRTKETQEKIKEYKQRFDYRKWLDEFIGKYEELKEKIPEQLHEQYTVWVNSAVYNNLIDYVILKSRQVGASTIFAELCAWYGNFHKNVVVLVVSQRDKEAIKFLNDVKTMYKLIPPYIRAKKLKDNDHELFISYTGNKEHQSIIQAFPPTADAGRSYSPNLVILDEFASYKKPEELMTAISFSISTGGILVIMSTPKGVGNLFHKIWTESIKRIQMVKDIDLEDINIGKGKINTVYKPYVIHWTQLPEEEFRRRGFERPIDWYRHMANYLIMQEGEKAVAQELDLAFLTSGNTALAGSVLEKLSKNILKKDVPDKDIQNIEELYQGLKIFEKPKGGKEYIIGVDTSEGVGKDYSVFYVLEIPDGKDTFVPKIVTQYINNRIDVNRYSDIIYKVATYYNEAWINIEKNNMGLAVIDRLMEKYKVYKILSTYRPNKKEDKIFDKNSKGWDTKVTTRKIMINNMIRFLTENADDYPIPEELYNDLLVFIDTGRKYEAMQGYHDDTVIAFSLALIGIDILHKYITWLNDYNFDEISQYTDIPSDIGIVSSLHGGLGKDNNEQKKEDIFFDDNFNNKIPEEKIEDVKEDFDKEEAIKNRQRKGVYRFVSQTVELDEDDYYEF